MTPDQIIAIIAALKRQGGEPDRLAFWRGRLVRVLHQRPAWRCVLCARPGPACRADPTLCPACDAALALRGLRHCLICGGVAPLASFAARPKGHGRRRQCRRCHNQRQYINQAASRRSAQARFHARNPDYGARRYRADPAQGCARTRAWRAKRKATKE